MLNDTMMSRSSDLRELGEGVRLGRYELLTPIANGGMASVWLGLLHGDLGFQKLVAIKTILAAHAREPQFRAMFVDEARIASQIDHPSVARVIDMGVEQGVIYQVLEWVDGDPVSTLHRSAARRGQLLSAKVALHIIAEVCAGLHAAHELKSGGRPQGVVHRDVSPQNILVSAAGSVKLIDFGIVAAQNRLTEKTQAGIVKGKLSFMSPEQALGRDVDRRSDIYSAGVMLYLLLEGRLPFGEQRMSLKNTFSPQTRVLGRHQSEVDRILATALARSREKRYPQAETMERDLRKVILSMGGLSRTDFAARVQPFRDQISARRIVINDAIEASNLRRKTAQFEPPLASCPAPEDSSSAPTVRQEKSPPPPSLPPPAPEPKRERALPVVFASALSSVALGALLVPLVLTPLSRHPLDASSTDDSTSATSKLISISPVEITLPIERKAQVLTAEAPATAIDLEPIHLVSDPIQRDDPHQERAPRPKAPTRIAARVSRRGLEKKAKPQRRTPPAPVAQPASLARRSAMSNAKARKSPQSAFQPVAPPSQLDFYKAFSSRK